jgi:PAS domain S-box-containing protein
MAHTGSLDQAASKAAHKVSPLLESILAVSRNGMLLLERGATIAYANPSVQRITGFEVSELVGQPWQSLFSDSNVPEVLAEMKRSLETAQPFMGVVQSPRKDAPAFWNEISLSPLADEPYILMEMTDVTARVVVETELRNTAQLLSSIVDHLPNMVFLKDAQTRHFKIFNHAAEEMLGYDREEMFGKTDFDVFPKEQAAFFTQLDSEALRDKELKVIPEEVIETRHQEKRILRTKKVPILDTWGEPLYLLGISEDITEQKDIERKLQESYATLENTVKERTQGLLSAIHALQQEVNLRKATEKALLRSEERYKLAELGTSDIIWDEELPSGHLTWNGCMEKLLGFDPEEVHEDPTWWKRHVHPEDLDRVRTSVQQAKEQGVEYWAEEYRFQNKNGDWRTLLDRAYILYDETTRQPVRMIGTITDITDHRKVEQALIESEQKFRAVFDSVMEPIAIQDNAGCLVDINTSALQYLNINKDDKDSVIGKPLSTFVNYSTRPDSLQRWQQFITTTEQRSGEAEIAHPDGSRRIIEYTAVPNFLPGYHLSVCRDITQKKQEEKEKALAHQRKDSFLANMSHEFRTPLNAIIGFSQMLQQGFCGPMNAKQTHYTGNIVSSGHQLLTMVNDILDIAKIEAGRVDLNLQAVAIRPMLLELEQFFYPIASEKLVSIRSHVADTLETVWIDPARFRQVLNNLVSNAIKFNRPNGEVNIRFSLSANGQWIQGSVEDTGVGIPADQMDELFSEFFQARNTAHQSSREGTGLGLALTKKLIERHGGAISVESTEGVGTIFRFRLPCQPQD